MCVYIKAQTTCEESGCWVSITFQPQEKLPHSQSKSVSMVTTTLALAHKSSDITLLSGHEGHEAQLGVRPGAEARAALHALHAFHARTVRRRFPQKNCESGLLFLAA